MIRVSLKYASLCGFLLTLLFFVSFLLGSHPLVAPKLMLFEGLIFFLFIFAAAREYRLYHNEKILHFWQGMSIGFFVFFPASALCTLGIWMLMSFDPMIFDSYKVALVDFLTSNEISLVEEFGKVDFEKRIESIKMSSVILSNFGKKIIIAFFVTPIVSLILRKKPT